MESEPFRPADSVILRIGFTEATFSNKPDGTDFVKFYSTGMNRSIFYIIGVVVVVVVVLKLLGVY